jgi:cation/acetate symporter
MNACKRLALLMTFIIALTIVPLSQAFAQTGDTNTNTTAIITFILFVAATLAITWFAAKKTVDKESFFAAKGEIPAWQNGLAIAGDFMSAATLLGITGLMFFRGMDAYILAFGLMVAWPIMLMAVAERFRNLGKFTFVDVVTYRLKKPSVRVLAALSSILVIIFYLIGQMVGAGKLIELLFGFDYIVAVSLVTALMMLYVIFGGMIATTWVQMIKAVLLLSGGLYMSFLVLGRFDFNFSAMVDRSMAVHPLKESLIVPGGWLERDFLQILSVGLTMCFGIMGLPHVLMRFFTVKDATAARNSVAVSTLIMSAFYVAILVLGLGAVALVWGEPEFLDASGNVKGGSNLVALHLAKSIGGDVLLGYMSAVTFATVLAVVAGLTLAGSATIAHDLYSVFRSPSSDTKSGNELLVSRIAALAIGAAALLLGVLFETQNIAVVTALALAIAASVNFPILLLSMYWRGLTSNGCVIGGGIALFTSAVLIVLSDGVWVQILGNAEPIHSFIYPTVFTMPICFVSIYVFSKLDKSEIGKQEHEDFSEQFIRSETGYGAVVHSES